MGGVPNSSSSKKEAASCVDSPISLKDVKDFVGMLTSVACAAILLGARGRAIGGAGSDFRFRVDCTLGIGGEGAIVCLSPGAWDLSTRAGSFEVFQKIGWAVPVLLGGFTGAVLAFNSGTSSRSSRQKSSKSWVESGGSMLETDADTGAGRTTGNGSEGYESSEDRSRAIWVLLSKKSSQTSGSDVDNAGFSGTGGLDFDAGDPGSLKLGFTVAFKEALGTEGEGFPNVLVDVWIIPEFTAILKDGKDGSVGIMGGAKSLATCIGNCNRWNRNRVSFLCAAGNDTRVSNVFVPSSDPSKTEHSNRPFSTRSIFRCWLLES